MPWNRCSRCHMPASAGVLYGINRRHLCGTCCATVLRELTRGEHNTSAAYWLSHESHLDQIEPWRHDNE